MAARYPRVVRVGARRYSVIYTNGLEAMGEFDMDGGEIRIRARLSRLDKATTLLHEIIHAISDTWGGNLSEEQTRCVEQGLASLIQDNPRLVAALVEDISTGP